MEYPGLSGVGRADLCVGWHLFDASDRLAAGRAQFQPARFEADFRFNLVRVRENSEQIALLKGEPAETDRLVERFNRVVANWLLIMTRTKKLSFFTNAYSQISIVFPYVVVSPAYFAGNMQLGGLMQTASAFNSVQTALSFFINVYRSLAEWQSVIQRLDGFSLAVAGAQAAAHTPPVIDIEATGDGHSVELNNVAVKLPNGAPLVATGNIKMPRGEPVLLTGPSGAGKSTLFGRSRASGRSAPAVSSYQRMRG